MRRVYMCVFIHASCLYVCVHSCVCIYVFIYACIYVCSFMRVYISACIFNATVIALSWCNAATDGPDEGTALKELP
jgi:hypothetical protein